MSHQGITVSCVLAMHREGLQAHTTLNSILKARRYAQSQGFSVQCVVTLDKADEKTAVLVASHPLLQESDVIESVEYGDLGLSRNHGIARSSGEYIVTLDGDDYYSENFIAGMIQEASQDKNSAVFPEFIFSFDAENYCVRLGGPSDSDENSYALFSEHHYCSRVAAHRSVFERVRYRACPKGFGFEDWHWVCEARGIGIVQKIATDTVLFYRRRPGSMVQLYANAHALILPSNFFETLPEPVKSIPASSFALFPVMPARSLIKNNAFFILSLLPQGVARRLYTILQGKLPKTLSMDYPLAVKKALLEVAAVDGRLHPEMLPPPEYRKPAYDISAGMAYAKVWHALQQKQFDIVCIGSHIFVGGADLMFANYMRAAAESGMRVLCLLTEDSKNDLSRIPEGVESLEFGKSTVSLSQEQKIMVLARLLVQLAPPIIHIVNDWWGFTVTKTYGNALLYQSRIFASIFADAQDEHDIHYGSGTLFLRDLLPFCTRIINDNWVTAREWSNRLGLPSSFFHPVYGVMEPVPKKKKIDASPPKVLWAGRLDREKRLDVLLQIAQAAPDITFDVYGRSVLIADAYINRLKAMPNVTLHGAYASFFDLPHEQYACLLYTTQSDGLPNVLLEAAACGLPVIAPNRGGVPDFITDDTGWLIQHYEDVAGYVQAIHNVLHEPEKAERRCNNAVHLLKKRHSYETFKKNLLSAYSATEPACGA